MALPKACFSAGHGMASRAVGAYDPGAIGCGQKEAEIVLGMVQRLSYDWAALGGKVYLRDTGNYAAADNEAFAAGCKIFLEVHLNAHADTTAHGTETWINTNTNGKEVALATNMCSKIAAIGFTNRGVKKTVNLAALAQYTGMDSALVEICFVTNRGDMTRYQGNVDKVELNMLNAILKTYGIAEVNSLPRTWSAPRTWMWRIFRK